MLIQLPAETWIEILDWLKRRDLVKKLDKLWDRQFTPIVQDWLHKYTRNVKIGQLWADKDEGLSVRLCKNRWEWEEVPFAEVEPPGNITSFEQIMIKYLDPTVLAFLHQMRPLFQQIQLGIDTFPAADALPTQIALRFLIPLISSIESFYLDCKFLQFFSANHASTLSNVKILNISDSQVSSEESEQVFINWLFTKRDDGLHRVLVFRSKDISGFYEKIRERFLDPARQCVACSPFFVRISINHEKLPPSMPDIENIRTGEQMTFKTVKDDDEEPYKLITNCPLNTDAEWLAKETKEVIEWDVNNPIIRAIWLETMEISPLYAEEDAASKQQASGSGKDVEEEEPDKKRVRLI